MPRELSFTINGDPSGGVEAFKRLRKEAEDSAKAIQATMNAVAGMAGNLGAVTAAVRSMREGAAATSRSVRSMSGNLAGFSARAREFASALKAQTAEAARTTHQFTKQRFEITHVQQAVKGTAQHAHGLRTAMSGVTAQTGVFRAGLTSSSVVLGRMLTQAALLSNRLAYGARAASQAFRGTSAGAAQGLQGLGIGFRMSGIAVGNQLANMGSQGIGGFLGGVAGAVAAGAEMAVRLVSSLTGTAVRLLGGAVGLILAPIGALAQGVGDMVGSVFSKAIGGTIAMGLQAVGGFVSAITNVVGEMASQVGNIFTGIMEAARGAFQGAVNIAANVLGKLVDVAGAVADKVGGVLGTIGKTVLGVGGTLMGFALHDFSDTESGLSKGIVLLDSKLSPADKKNLRSWADDLHKQMPTITRAAFGDTFQRVVSTGFSGDLAGAKKATEAAVRLQFAAEGGGSPADAARLIAKTRSVFGTELEAFGDPMQRISDLLFQTVNAADVSLSDLVTHLGEVIGPAKALGMTFEDLLVLVSKMSRTAGTEQTFTGLRRLILEPLKMSKEASGLLSKHGINPLVLSGEEEAAIRAKQKAVADKEAEIAALETSKRHGPEEAAATRKAEASARAAAVATARVAIAQARTPQAAKAAREALAVLQAQQANDVANQAASRVGESPGADATEKITSAKAELKALKAELNDFQKTAGTVTDLSGFLDKLAKAGIGAKELAVVFPDIRALTAAMTLGSQDPKMAAAIEGMIRNGTGKVGDAVAEQASTVKVKMLQLWEGLKAPFHATLESIETPFKGFLDRMVSGLKGLTKWWEKALIHPALGGLLANIGGKVGGLFKSIFGTASLKMPSQGAVWHALSDGLDKVWSFGTKVVNVFKTLGGAVLGLVGESETLGKVWDKMKAAGAWLGDTFKQLSNGSTKNLSDAWQGMKGGFDTLWNGAAKALEPVWEKATAIWGDIKKVAVQVGDTIVTAFRVAAATLKNLLPLLGALALAPAARAIGAAFRPPSIVSAAAAAGGGAVGSAVVAGRAGAGGPGAARTISGGSTDALMGSGAGRGALSLGGPGLLRRRDVWRATEAYLPQHPMVPGPVVRPVAGGLSKTQAKRLSEDGVINAADRQAAPMQGPLAYPSREDYRQMPGWSATVPPVYGGWQRGSYMGREEWNNGRYTGRPDIMGPENDALFRGRRAVQLTPTEAMAFHGRYPGGATQPFMPDAAYYNSPGFAATRGGGPVPMSDAERMATTWTRGERARLGAKRLGGVAMSGLRTAGRWAAGPGGMMAGSLGLAMGGAAASESGHPIMGGALSGASMGMLGFSLGPVIGAATTLGAALLGAAKAANDYAKAESTRKQRESNERAVDYVKNNADRSPAELLSRLRSAGKGGSFEDAVGFGTAKVAVEAESARASFDLAKAGDFAGAIELLTAARGYKGAPVLNGSGGMKMPAADQVLSDRNTTFEAQIAAWQKALSDAALVTEQAAAAERSAAAVRSAAITKATGPFDGLAAEIQAVEDEIANFATGESSLKTAAEAVTYLKAEITTLEEYIASTNGALDGLPEGAEDAAAGLSDLALAAGRTVDLAREVLAQKTAEAAAGKSLSAGVVVAQGPWEVAPATAVASEEVTTALEDLAEATSDATDAMQDTAVATQDAARMMRVGAGAMTIPQGGYKPADAGMTPGEGRAAKRANRQAAHQARLRANNPMDQFGNHIDPFTGLPTVGDFGGVGWGVRMGDGDMGFNGRPSSGGLSSSKGPSKSVYDPKNQTADGGYTLSDGTVFYPKDKDGGSLLGPKPSPVNGAAGGGASGGGAGTAAKNTAASARDAADATKELVPAINATGAAMNDVTKAATGATGKMAKLTETTKQKVDELHEADLALDTRIKELAAAPTSVSAEEAGL